MADFTETIPYVKERRLATGFCHVRVHYLADPDKDRSWALRRSTYYGGMDTPKWRREYEIDYDAVQGQAVYPMLSNQHIKSRDLVGRTFYRVIDHGIRHPTVCLWVAVNTSGDRHVFREYYMTDKTVDFNCREIERRTSEPISDSYIDPATRQRVPLSQRDKAPVSVLSLYRDSGIHCLLADNSRAGYDSVRDGLLSALAREVVTTGSADSYMAKEYFPEMSNDELLAMAARPSLTFEPSCPKVFKEMKNLRFKDVSGDPASHAQPEQIIDFEDDGPDCVRYAMQSPLCWRQALEKGSYLYEINERRYVNPRKIRRTTVYS